MNKQYTAGDSASQATPKPADSEALVTSRAICRIPSYTGLAHRRVPLDAGVLPKALVHWCSAAPKPSQRSTKYAPVHYLVLGEHGDRLVPDNHSDPSAFAQSRRRLRLTERRRGEPGEGVGQPQSLLSPRQLAALGHILTGIKYSTWGFDVHEHHSLSDRCEIHVRPAALVHHRLGYQICGTAYQQLEDDLATLARTWVVMERRVGNDWQALRSEPLLQFFNSGRIHINDGKDVSPEPAEDGKPERRHRSWSLALGHGLVAMLKTQPSDLFVISPALWRSAQRSPLGQWLALFFSGHGFDGNRIHPHRLSTLVARMRLCPDETYRALTESGVLGQHAEHVTVASDEAGSWEERPAPPLKRPKAKRQPKNLRKETRVLRLAMNQIVQAFHRLKRRSGLADFQVIPADAPSDIPPSLIGKRRSRFDKVGLKRWSAEIESLVPSLPSWVLKRHEILPRLDRLTTRTNGSTETPAVQAVAACQATLEYALQQLDILTRHSIADWRSRVVRFVTHTALALAEIRQGLVGPLMRDHSPPTALTIPT